jgi:hypothetical protein
MFLSGCNMNMQSCQTGIEPCPKFVWFLISYIECSWWSASQTLSWYLFIFFWEVDAYYSYILGRVWRFLNIFQRYLLQIPDLIACAWTNDTQMSLKCPSNTLNSHQTWIAAHWNFFELTQGHCITLKHSSYNKVYEFFLQSISNMGWSCSFRVQNKSKWLGEH